MPRASLAKLSPSELLSLKKRVWDTVLQPGCTHTFHEFTGLVLKWHYRRSQRPSFLRSIKTPTIKATLKKDTRLAGAVYYVTSKPHARGKYSVALSLLPKLSRTTVRRDGELWSASQMAARKLARSLKGDTDDFLAYVQSWVRPTKSSFQKIGRQVLKLNKSSVPLEQIVETLREGIAQSSFEVNVRRMKDQQIHLCGVRGTSPTLHARVLLALHTELRLTGMKDHAARIAIGELIGKDLKDVAIRLDRTHKALGNADR